jgi:hypothetical protein
MTGRRQQFWDAQIVQMCADDAPPSRLGQPRRAAARWAFSLITAVMMSIDIAYG